MISPIVNALAIVMGSLIGLLLKKGIPERLSTSLMKALALCVIYIGIKGVLTGEKTLMLIIAIVIGTLIGEGIDLDKRVHAFGDWIESKIKKNDKSETSIAEGFVAATLLFGVGAMAIIGSLQSGLTGDHETIFTKSIIDFVVAMIFTTTKGVGVMLSGVAILFYQGSIVLASTWLAPLLTEGIINEMTVIGSLIIIALGLNMLEVTKIKVMNLVPAIFLPIILMRFM